VQTHYDVRHPEFWQLVHGVYDYIITQPPTDVAESIIIQGQEHCSLIALLLTPEKVSQLQTVLAHKPPSISIAIGNSHSWLIWAPSLAYRNFYIEISEADLAMRTRLSQEDFALHIQDRISQHISRASFAGQHAAAAAAAAAAASPFMSSHPFYHPQTQFQHPAAAYSHVGFGYPGDPSAVDQYFSGTPYGKQRDSSTNPAAAAAAAAAAYGNAGADANKRASDSSPAGTAAAAANTHASGNSPVPTSNATNAVTSNPAFVDFSSLGAAYPTRHPSAAYAQPVLPYYSRPTQPPSPTQSWQFQQHPWASPGLSAAHMASTLGPSPASHVPGHYPPPPFNPAAILMDMDKLTQGGTVVPGRELPPGTVPMYGLHKPTAFKPGNNLPPNPSTSPGPSAAAVAAAMEDQQLMLSQAEMLYLKGVHAAKQGKALEVAIDKYRSMYSKKDVITKVCKMKYRSAQRKLRIAKHIQRFPEISTMTQRQAERYISEKLRKSRGNGESRASGSEED